MSNFQLCLDGAKTTVGDGTGRLVLSGDLSIRNAQMLYQQILDAKEKCSALHIVLEQVTSVDLALLQILFALRRDVGGGIQLTVDEHDSSVTKWFATSGLTSLIQSA